MVAALPSGTCRVGIPGLSSKLGWQDLPHPVAGMWLCCVCLCVAQLHGGKLELCMVACAGCQGRGHGDVGVYPALGDCSGVCWLFLAQQQGGWASGEEL